MPEAATALRFPDRRDPARALRRPSSGRGIAAASGRWSVGAALRAAARQDRIGDFEDPTDGYLVGDVSAGLRLQRGANRAHASRVPGSWAGAGTVRPGLRMTARP